LYYEAKFNVRMTNVGMCKLNTLINSQICPLLSQLINLSTNQLIN